MADKKQIKYGDKTMDMPDGMTLDQAKQQMARFFPELAEPEVKTEKKNDKTIYVFSKKAGRKGIAPTSTIRAYCYICGAPFECEPDDVIGYDDETPIYLCPKCDFSVVPDDDDRRDPRIQKSVVNYAALQR